MEKIINDVIDYFKNNILALIIACLVAFFLYAMLAVLLNNLNESKTGKISKIAWLPIFNIYLIGKLAVNSILGIILIIALLFGVVILVDIKELAQIHEIIPKDYAIPYIIIYCVILLILIIICRKKYKKIMREGKSKDEITTFASKDFSKKEPEIVVKKEEIKPIVKEEPNNDTFSYDSFQNTKDIPITPTKRNVTSLANLRNLSNVRNGNEDNQNNNSQNP